MLLKAAVNGARSRGEHPALPITPADLAVAALGVQEAGAGAVHLHVKDADGADTFDAQHLARVLRAVRPRCPGMPIGVTTGAWALSDPGERVAAIGAWTVLPDFASVNWHEDGADDVATALLARGVGVEAGLWHAEAVGAWTESPNRGRCLRILLELPDGLDQDATAAEAERLLGLLDTRSGVLLHGEGTSCWPALQLAADLGLDARIGLEDTLMMPNGSPAIDNADLVRHARDLIATLAGDR